ncbi:MAG: ABC transporter permease [Deltaproteobacteria bacterium]
MQIASPLPFGRVIAALLIREMITRYGRTPGGYIWAILEPAGMIFLFALAFSQFIHAPPLGTSFILFYATGYLPYHAYSDIAGTTSQAVAFNRQLMQLPMVKPLDTIIARFILGATTLVIVVFMIFAGMLFLIDDQIAFTPAPLLLALFAASCLGLGIGTLNTVLFQFFPIWERLWPIISRPLLLISGVFYLVESLPGHARDIITWNPLVHIIGEARLAFYPAYHGDYIDMSYVFAIALGTFLLGSALLLRHASRFIEAT